MATKCIGVVNYVIAIVGMLNVVTCKFKHESQVKLIENHYQIIVAGFSTLKSPVEVYWYKKTLKS